MNLSLKMHVKLMEDKRSGRKENFHQEFEVRGKTYMNLDIQSFLTLEYRDKNVAWDRSQSIVINQRNLHVIVNDMGKMIKHIYGNDVFKHDAAKGHSVVYAEDIEKYTVRMYNLTANQRIVLKPAMIMGDSEEMYEGVIMYINNSDNVVELVVDAFESLYNTLKRIDLFLYSQSIVNYYAACIETGKIKVGEDDAPAEQPKPKKHPLTAPPKVEEPPQTTSSIPQKKEDFFGINNK